MWVEGIKVSCARGSYSDIEQLIIIVSDTNFILLFFWFIFLLLVIFIVNILAHTVLFISYPYCWNYYSQLINIYLYCFAFVLRHWSVLLSELATLYNLCVRALKPIGVVKSHTSSRTLECLMNSALTRICPVCIRARL